MSNFHFLKLQEMHSYVLNQCSRFAGTEDEAHYKEILAGLKYKISEELESRQEET